MPVKCQVIVDTLDKIAPKYLAENWDNVGLLIGSPAQAVSKILVALDVTESVVEQAISIDADMIIAHHPIFFKGIKNIRTDLPQGRLLARLIKNDIAVYAAHTNLDIADGGVNDILAGRFNLSSVESIIIEYADKLVKLAVFVPIDHADSVRSALFDAGTGHIGNYSHCTFQTVGTGTFMPLSGTQPFIGEQNKLEQVTEVRLETIMPERISKRVVKAMLKSHPYEEVAYDLYPLTNVGPGVGLGRVGNLSTPKKLADFIAEVKKVLEIDSVNVVGSPDKLIQRVAVCGGSGAGLIQKAAFVGADVLVTGDVKYHEAQQAVDSGIAIIDAGHFATENVVVGYLGKYLENCACQDKWIVEINIDSTSRDVFCRY